MAGDLLDHPLKKARYTVAKAAADNLTGVYTTPPIPVLEIAEKCGVNVIFTEFSKHSDTIAGFCDFSGKKLYVNSADHPNRQFFTIAHELGHWVLHKDYFIKEPEKYSILPRYQSPTRGDPFEQEANCFAAQLLVPERLLSQVRGSPEPGVAYLARIFIVSREMMENRLKNVG
jgi:Zn-dependent peptidase ImmA (M78 family)